MLKIAYATGFLDTFKFKKTNYNAQNNKIILFYIQLSNFGL